MNNADVDAVQEQLAVAGLDGADAPPPATDNDGAATAANPDVASTSSIPDHELGLELIKAMLTLGDHALIFEQQPVTKTSGGVLSSNDKYNLRRSCKEIKALVTPLMKTVDLNIDQVPIRKFLDQDWSHYVTNLALAASSPENDEAFQRLESAASALETADFANLEKLRLYMRYYPSVQTDDDDDEDADQGTNVEKQERFDAAFVNILMVLGRKPREHWPNLKEINISGLLSSSKLDAIMNGTWHATEIDLGGVHIADEGQYVGGNWDTAFPQLASIRITQAFNAIAPRSFVSAQLPQLRSLFLASIYGGLDVEDLQVLVEQPFLQTLTSLGLDFLDIDLQPLMSALDNNTHLKFLNLQVNVTATVGHYRLPNLPSLLELRLTSGDGPALIDALTGVEFPACKTLCLFAANRDDAAEGESKYCAPIPEQFNYLNLMRGFPMLENFTSHYMPIQSNDFRAIGLRIPGLKKFHLFHEFLEDMDIADIAGGVADCHSEEDWGIKEDLEYLEELIIKGGDLTPQSLYHIMNWIAPYTKNVRVFDMEHIALDDGSAWLLATVAGNGVWPNLEELKLPIRTVQAAEAIAYAGRAGWRKLNKLVMYIDRDNDDPFVRAERWRIQQICQAQFQTTYML